VPPHAGAAAPRLLATPPAAVASSWVGTHGAVIVQNLRAAAAVPPCHT